MEPQRRSEFKTALIYEKMALMICFSLHLSEEYQREIMFVRKSVLLAYSSLFVFLCHVLQLFPKSWMNVNLPDFRAPVQGGPDAEDLRGGRPHFE